MPDYGRYDREDTRSNRPASRYQDSSRSYDNDYRRQPQRTAPRSHYDNAEYENEYDENRSHGSRPNNSWSDSYGDDVRRNYSRTAYRRTPYRYEEGDYRRAQPGSRGSALNRPGDREEFGMNRNTYVRRNANNDYRRTNAYRSADAYRDGDRSFESRQNNRRPSAPLQSNRRPVEAPNRRPANQTNEQQEKQPLNLSEIFMRVPRWGRLAIFAVLIIAVLGGGIALISGLTRGNDAQVVMVPGSSGELTPAATDVPAVDEQPVDETASDQTGVLEPDATVSDGVWEEVGTDANGERVFGSDMNDIEALLGGGDSGETQTPVAPASPAVDPATLVNTAPVASNGMRQATIRMAGDVIIDTEMLEASYDKVMEYYNFDPYFEMIGDTLSRSDYTMINIEASLRKGKYGYSGYPQFTTPPVILDAVKKVGADMITMCNNHMLDGYCDGLVESVGLVEKAGLDHIGGYVDEADSNTPEIYEINGIKVGFVTYTHSTNSMENHCDDRTKYLVNYFRSSNCATDIANARAAGAEVIVAVTHWGEEYKREPESSTRNLAKKLVAAGADIIIGGHPHMAQPMEYITATDANGQSRTALCLYSLGNFLSQHRVQYTDSGVVFEFTIQENTDGTFSIVNPGYVPVYVWTFKNGEGEDDYRVMPIGNYLNNPPSGMSSEQINRMTECWNETLELMNNDSVAQPLLV